DEVGAPADGYGPGKLHVWAGAGGIQIIGDDRTDDGRGANRAGAAAVEAAAIATAGACRHIVGQRAIVDGDLGRTRNVNPAAVNFGRAAGGRVPIDRAIVEGV